MIMYIDGLGQDKRSTRAEDSILAGSKAIHSSGLHT